VLEFCIVEAAEQGQHMKAQSKFLVGSAIIVLTLVFLAYVGYTQSKTYYHTISELGTLQGASLEQHMRVSGNVQKGSIAHRDGRIDFVLEEQGKVLPISYVGRDPLPDTFKDGAQALAEGKLMPDGHFVADQIQAKCASKYQAAPISAPASAQSSQTMNDPAAATAGAKN
jgi:cytochrome c-type biogenesis protein CcmE